MPSPDAPPLDWALWYAALGLAIFPCSEIGPDGICVCPDGVDCASPGKHPRVKHGLFKASTNPAQITSWLRWCPTTNWSARTGDASGVDVLDSDICHGDPETLARLEREYGPFPDTVTALTPSGGKHQYFRHHDGMHNSAGRLGPGVDVRGDGGYIMVAPSNHRVGGCYHWLAGHAPGEIAIAPWPPRLAAALLVPKRPPPSMAARPDGLVARIPEGLIAFAERGAPHGQQANSGFWLACRLREHGVGEHEGWAIMERFATACTPPADLTKLARIWRDSAKYQGYQPYRCLPEPTRRPSFTLAEPERRPSVIVGSVAP